MAKRYKVLRRIRHRTRKIDRQSGEPVTAMVIFRGRTRGTSCGGQVSHWTVEISETEEGGWSRACRTVRPFLDATGDSSVEAAIRADTTLGLTGVTASVASVGAERRVEFRDGFRWLAELELEVRY